MILDALTKGMRKTIIAGNWKMNKTPSEAKALLEEIIPLVKDANCEVIACVPYVDLATAVEVTKDTNIKIGAENCHWAESGAFTGEISTGMLKESVTPSADSISARPTRPSTSVSRQL